MEINTGLVSSVGLLLDVIGAFFLSKSFVVKAMSEVFNETRAYFNGNPFALKSMVQQRLEARVGFIFLSLGFLFQFATYTGKITNGISTYDTYLVIAGIVLLAICIFAVEKIGKYLRLKALSQEYGQSIINGLTNKDGHTSSNRKNFEFYAKVFEIKFPGSISDEDFKKLLIREVSKHKPKKRSHNPWDQLFEKI